MICSRAYVWEEYVRWYELYGDKADSSVGDKNFRAYMEVLANDVEASGGQVINIESQKGIVWYGRKV
jgi:hypothetical protein